MTWEILSQVMIQYPICTRLFSGFRYTTDFLNFKFNSRIDTLRKVRINAPITLLFRNIHPVRAHITSVKIVLAEDMPVKILKCFVIWVDRKSRYYSASLGSLGS